MIFVKGVEFEEDVFISWRKAGLPPSHPDFLPAASGSHFCDHKLDSNHAPHYTWTKYMLCYVAFKATHNKDESLPQFMCWELKGSKNF